MFVSSRGTQRWRPEIGKKHLEFIFARREVYFLFWTFENLDKCFSLYLHCLECWKSPAESFWRHGTALPQPSSWCHARLKLFYCQKNWRYRAKELWRDIFVGNLSLKDGKNSVGLPVLILEFWWRYVQTKNCSRSVTFILFCKLLMRCVGVMILRDNSHS